MFICVCSSKNSNWYTVTTMLSVKVSVGKRIRYLGYTQERL